MTKFCTTNNTIPKVLDSKGNKVESRLFKDLLSYSPSREKAVEFYLITKNEKFIQTIQPRLTLDENSEPLFSSLLENTNMIRVLDSEKILEKLNRQIGHYKKGMKTSAKYIKNAENYNKLLDRVKFFNKNSMFRGDFVAKLINIPDDESTREFYGLKVFPRNNMLSLEASKMEYDININTRIRELLASKGISVGALNELEERLHINGVTDFNLNKNVATGLIELIRLAEGIRGEKALPEEFAHFIIEAMQEDLVVKRLLNYINTQGVVQEILGEEYDTYKNLYNNDSYKLAKEAAGKLLAKHFLQVEPIEKPYKNILERVINAVKEFLKNIGSNNVRKALLNADDILAKMASETLYGDYMDNVSIDNIKNSDSQYYQLDERIQRDKNLVNNIINNEAKRLKIYGERNPKGDFSVTQKLFIDKLELQLLENNEIEAIYSFTEHAVDELKKLRSRLNVLRNSDNTKLNEKAAVLRDVRNYLSSYGKIITEIREALLDEEMFADNRYGNRVRVMLDQFSPLMDELNITYNKVVTPLFVDFIRPYIGEGILVPFGKYKGQVITAEKLTSVAESDITFMDAWLDSMAESSDFTLKIIDQKVKSSKETARLRVLEISKNLQNLTRDLEKQGIKDTVWMFQKDEKGNLTGEYISKINTYMYKKNQKEMYANLIKKYGKYPVGKDAIEYTKERKAWYANNSEFVDGVRVPKYSVYEDKNFKNLSPVQLEYYNKVMQIKAELDSLLPSKTTYTENAVKIRKDLIERIKSSSSIKEGVNQFIENIKDDFIRRTDDTEFGIKSTIQDFDNNKVHTLPIYYTKLKEGESANDISTDIVSTLSAYAAMAVDYDEMSKIIDILELSKSVIQNRRAAEVEGGKPLVESFNIMGVKVNNPLYKQGSKTNITKKLENYFESQVYGKYMKDEGTIGNTNIDKGKVANFINKVTALNNLAFNVLSGISNIATGKVMMRIESISGEFFNMKNVANADLIYTKELPSFLSQIGRRVKNNKLFLWNEYFNVMQEYEEDIRNINFDRKTIFSKMFSKSSLFFMSNAGEHYMQTRTSLALSETYKMKTPNGKIVSLWEAMEVVPIDPNNPEGASRLQIKNGYTKEDGTEFTKEDLIKFSRKSAGINQKMHGIYNKLDQSAVQRLALGRMVLLFRKWVKPSLNRRFDKASYNYDLESWTEGYYNTTGKFVWQLLKDVKELQFNIGARWSSLNKTEKSNIVRASVEVAHFAILAAFLGILDNLGDDDDDRPWLNRMLEYQARRLYTEIGAMIPGKPMLTEGFRLLESPAAGINTLESISDLLNLMFPSSYSEEITRGRYTGHSPAYRTFMNSPLVPFNKTIYKAFHPESVIPFFTSGK